MSSPRQLRPTFRDVVAEVTAQPAHPPMTPDRNLATEDEFVDDDGVPWRRRRGARLEGRELLRALRAPGLVVLHDYGGEATPVPADAREEFAASISARASQSEHSRFYGASFRSPDHAHLLVVHEDC